MKRSQSILAMGLIAACAIGASLQSASAAPITFFGEDTNNGNNATSHPNSDAAQASFFSNLTNIGQQNLDTFSPGQTTISPTFTNGVTATLSGGSVSATVQNGQFPISSPNYYVAETAQFSIALNSPIAAFGFYATDVGDYGGLLSLTLTDIHGNKSTLNVPALSNSGVGGTGPTNGSVLYYGFYDLSDTYTSIAFNNSASNADTFAFDNFSVGTTAQVTPVPEPLTVSLFGAGLAGVAAIRRRTKKS